MTSHENKEFQPSSLVNAENDCLGLLLFPCVYPCPRPGREKGRKGGFLYVKVTVRDRDGIITLPLSRHKR